jgi:transposase
MERETKKEDEAMGKKSDLPVEQRVQAVLMLLRREETLTVLARRFEVSENTLGRWRDEFLAAGEAGLRYGREKADTRDRRILEQDKALAERDRVIGELTIANRILKKNLGETS